MGCCGSQSGADDQLWAYVKPDAGYGTLDPSQVEVLGTLLAQKKIDINCTREGDTALHWVCREQAPPSRMMIDFLCKHKPNLEAKNAAQKTPLHCAIGGAAGDNVRALLEHGGDVNAKGAFASTPIMYACALGLHKNIDILIERKDLDVDYRNDNGDTALNRLARLGSRNRNDPEDLRIAEALVSRGALVDTVNREGFTPLLSACVSGKSNLIAYFIGLGASLESKNMYKEGTKELATREHVKLVLRSYEVLRSIDPDGFTKPIVAIILLYLAAAGGTDKSS